MRYSKDGKNWQELTRGQYRNNTYVARLVGYGEYVLSSNQSSCKATLVTTKQSSSLGKIVGGLVAVAVLIGIVLII
jgi:hypothetical protein